LVMHLHSVYLTFDWQVRSIFFKSEIESASDLC
jgi:hypothetical protein